MDLLDDDRVLDLRPRARRTDAAAVIDEERRRAPPLPAANAALRGWEGPVPEPTARESPAGPCAICATRAARTACPACGLGVCATDLWSMLGLCKRCAAERSA